MVGFKKYMQAPLVAIGSGESTLDIPNSTVIIQVNDTPIL